MNPTGKFIWYELLSPNLAASEAFYSSVVGWTLKDSGMTDRRYMILHAGEIPVGGLMQMPEEAQATGMPTLWMAYINVDDVEAAIAKATGGGGKVHRPAEDIPGVGRFAVLADPHGAGFMVMKPIPPEGGPPPQPAPGTPGTVGWRELSAGDGAEAFTFYQGMFGWKHRRDFDMGPMGAYRIFTTGEDDDGGIMTKMPNIPAPFWLYYFNVEGIDAAAERVKSAGGQVLNGPMQVPTGAWIIQAADPQGAMIGLLSQTK